MFLFENEVDNNFFKSMKLFSEMIEYFAIDQKNTIYFC